MDLRANPDHLLTGGLADVAQVRCHKLLTEVRIAGPATPQKVDDHFCSVQGKESGNRQQQLMCMSYFKSPIQ